ncbi:MAG: hypothetical protein K2O69_02260, partial [Odoribacter sp.]|nr:hypothetical protein [Odoribacter sp.]
IEPFTLTLDNNKVILTEANEYTRKEGWKIHSREWRYSNEGSLSILYDGSYPNEYYPTQDPKRIEYKYNEGNLVSISEKGSERNTFSYNDKSEYNNGVEWASCYYALYSAEYPDLLFAIFTNMTGKKSAYLPTLADGMIEFTYTLDEDKYLTKVNWETEEGLPAIVTFEYED